MLLESAMVCYYKVRQLFFKKMRQVLLQSWTGTTKCDGVGGCRHIPSCTKLTRKNRQRNAPWEGHILHKTQWAHKGTRMKLSALTFTLVVKFKTRTKNKKSTALNTLINICRSLSFQNRYSKAHSRIRYL